MDRLPALICVIFVISVTVLLGVQCEEATTSPIVVQSDTDKVTTDITPTTTWTSSEEG